MQEALSLLTGAALTLELFLHSTHQPLSLLAGTLPLLLCLILGAVFTLQLLLSLLAGAALTAQLFLQSTQPLLSLLMGTALAL